MPLGASFAIGLHIIRTHQTANISCLRAIFGAGRMASPARDNILNAIVAANHVADRVRTRANILSFTGTKYLDSASMYLYT
jgi:hypothetical protein